MAISQLETDFFLALDVDFVTNKGAHEQLRNLYTTWPNLTDMLKNKTLVVWPAFGPVATQTAAPDNKNQVQSWYKQGLIEPFQRQQFPAKHGPTQYELWFQNSSQVGPSYPISYQTQFEPFVLAYRHGLPRYSSGFAGHTYNRSSWTAETHRLGYRFQALRDFFVFSTGTTPAAAGRDAPVLKAREWQNFLAYKERIYNGNRTIQNTP